MTGFNALIVTGRALLAVRHVVLQICLLLALTACSSPRELAVSQQDFQALINRGFLSPRIIAINLPVPAQANLYLETPQVSFSDSRSRIDITVSGQIDVDFAGQIASGLMPVVLEGSAALVIKADEQALFLDRVAIKNRQVTAESGLIQKLVLEALAGVVADALNNILLMTVPEDSPVSAFLKEYQNQKIHYRIEPDHIVLAAKQRDRN